MKNYNRIVSNIQLMLIQSSLTQLTKDQRNIEEQRDELRNRINKLQSQLIKTNARKDLIEISNQLDTLIKQLGNK